MSANPLQYLDSVFAPTEKKAAEYESKQFVFKDDELTTTYTLANHSAAFNTFVNFQRRSNGNCIDFSSGFACLDAPKENAVPEDKNPRCASLISLKLFVELFEHASVLADRLEENGLELISEWKTKNQSAQMKGNRLDMQKSFPIASATTRGKYGRADDQYVLEMKLNCFGYNSKNQFVVVPAPMRLKDLKVSQNFFKKIIRTFFLFFKKITVSYQVEDDCRNRGGVGQVEPSGWVPAEEGWIQRAADAHAQNA